MVTVCLMDIPDLYQEMNLFYIKFINNLDLNGKLCKKRKKIKLTAIYYLIEAYL